MHIYDLPKWSQEDINYLSKSITRNEIKVVKKKLQEIKAQD
jgi:hypothetical protein